MANILDKYGIKEVADVTFYEINNDGSVGAPALYLDTLKVSTIEQTAEEAEARGGKGNPPLIIWDYGKEITVTLEDALFSAKSMSIMFGNGTVSTDMSSLKKTFEWVADSTTAPSSVEINGKSYALDSVSVYDAFGSAVTTYVAGTKYLVTGTLLLSSAAVIDISANSFPGTYYVTGDTYARSEITGKDEFFQFIISKAKVQSGNTITLEAEGDPSVFNMNLRVLRPTDGGAMMKLVKYDME